VNVSAVTGRPSLEDFMRIRVYSDLHLEFGPFDPPAIDDVDMAACANLTQR
jgi:hypothetical protein